MNAVKKLETQQTLELLVFFHSLSSMDLLFVIKKLGPRKI